MTPLPAAVTPLLGRDADLSSLMGHIDRHRVVTLVGGGGIGKTSLAVEAAHRLAGGGRRVGFVELADTRTVRDLTAAIAGQLAIETTAGSSDRDGIVHALGAAPTVLFLDNLEHLADADAGADLLTLIDDCPGLHVVVTSRCALGDVDECVVEVPALDAGAARGERYGPAVALFFARARIESPTNDDIAIAERIVDSLGSIPLAIELAAARARTLGPTNVLDLLVSELALDGLTQPGGVDRHRSVRRCIEWSVGCLPESAQRIFRVTGAFAGTFDLRALRAVAGAAPTTAVGIAALLDHHLVERVEQGPGRPARFRSVPPVRELAHELLVTTDESEAVLGAHATWYEARAAALWTDAARTSIEVVMERFWTDEANFRRAIRHRATHGQYATAATTLAELAKVAIERGREHEVNIGFQGLADAAAADGVELPGEARIWVSYVHLANRRAPRGSAALDQIEAEIAAARGRGDRLAELIGLDRVVCSVFFHGDVARALVAAREGVTLADRLDLTRKLGEFSLWLGMLEHVIGDVAGAIRHGKAAMEIARELGDRRLMIRTVLLFAPLEITGQLEGHDLGPVPSLETCRATAQELHSVIDEMYVLMQLAMRAGLRGEPEVYEHVLDGLALAERTRSHVAEVVFVLALAASAARLDDPVVARLHAALEPQWSTLAVSVPSSALERYLMLVDRHRLADLERFEASRSASSVDWLETVPLAVEHAEKCRDRRRPSDTVLTPRELEVLGELAGGATNKEIAARLGLRPKTVMHHCGSIFRKLDVSTRAEATSVALRTGLVDLD